MAGEKTKAPRRVSELRQLRRVVAFYLRTYNCGGCGRIRPLGYICPWIDDDCPGDPNRD